MKIEVVKKYICDRATLKNGKRAVICFSVSVNFFAVFSLLKCDIAMNNSIDTMNAQSETIDRLSFEAMVMRELLRLQRKACGWE